MSNYLRQRQLRARKPPRPAQADSSYPGNSEPRLPHEHDESSDSQAGGPCGLIEQARRDIESGQQDTDAHGMRGLEKPERRRDR